MATSAANFMTRTPPRTDRRFRRATRPTYVTTARRQPHATSQCSRCGATFEGISSRLAILARKGHERTRHPLR